MHIRRPGLNVFTPVWMSLLMILLCYVPGNNAEGSDPSEEPITASELPNIDTITEVDNSSLLSPNPPESDTQPPDGVDGNDSQPTTITAEGEPSAPTTTAANEVFTKWYKNLIAAKYMTALGVLYIAICVFMAVKAGPLVVH